jgi:WD40 repeat protein
MLVAQVMDRTAPREGPYPRRLFVWDAAARKDLQNIKLPPQEPLDWGMHASATTRVGSILAAGRASEEVRLADGVRVTSRKLGPSVGAWCNRDGSESLWLTTDGLEKFRFAYGKMPPFVPDGKREGAREQWLETEFEGQWDGVLPVVTVNGDLTRLAVASPDRSKLVLYNITTAGKLVLTRVAAVPRAHEAPLSFLRFSPDGKALATGAHDASVCLWDVEKAGKDWEPRARIANGNFPVEALAFSPDGRTLAAAAAGRGGNLHIIDVAAGKAHVSYRLEGLVLSLAYSPDGTVLATGHSHGRVATWNADALRNP